MSENSSVTIHEWLQRARSKLKAASIPSFSLDALLLLEHVTKLDRAHILAHDNKQLSGQESAQLERLLSKRSDRIPLAYLTNSIEFYGRKFFVNENVLIPRPESEAFIELIVDLPKDLTLIDIGCGSGVLGITAKLEQPTYQVMLSDISHTALYIARKNSEVLRADIDTIKMDLLTNLPSSIDVVIANLPYVPTTINLEPELTKEPPVALFSKKGGMEHYHRLWQQLTKYTPHFVLTESLAIQHKLMNNLAFRASYRPVRTIGLVQMFERI